MAAAFGAALLVAALAGEAPARSSGCFETGEIVTFDGVASSATQAAGARQSGWMLNLTTPICVMRISPFAPTANFYRISAIRIVGTPPPPGVPLSLTGKLLLGRRASDSAMFVALEVIRGRKIATAGSVPPANSVFQDVRTTDDRCNKPPYGGTAAEFQGFVNRFGRIVTPAKILTGICNAKFGRSPRAGLHKLGFTDAKIESENTEQLAADTILALKTLVNTIE